MKRKSVIKNGIIMLLCVIIIFNIISRKNNENKMLTYWKLSSKMREAVEKYILTYDRINFYDNSKGSKYIVIDLIDNDSIILTCHYMGAMNDAPFPNIECGEVLGKTIVLSLGKYRHMIEIDLDKKIDFYKNILTEEHYQRLKKDSIYVSPFGFIMGYSFKSKKLSVITDGYLETEEDQIIY